MSVTMAGAGNNEHIRVLNNQTVDIVGKKGSLIQSARKQHSLQPLIKTKPRQSGLQYNKDGTIKDNRGILSPYRDKPMVAEKIMQRTNRPKFGSVVENTQ